MLRLPITLALASAALTSSTAWSAVIASTSFEGTPGEIAIASETFIAPDATVGPSPEFGAVAEDPLSGLNAYLIEDTDAFLEVAFAPVDLTLVTGASVSVNYSVERTANGNFGGNDSLLIEAIYTIGGSDTTITLFNGTSTGTGVGEVDIDDPTIKNAGYLNAAALIPDLAESVVFRIVGNTSSDSEQFHLDDFSVSGTVIPEPSSLLLASFGLAAVGLRRRRQA